MDPHQNPNPVRNGLHTDIKIKAGVIEGFFGKPWDWSARLSGASFLRDCGYGFFIYAPKSESFLRRGWREPFPERSLEHLRELAGRCRQSNVAFGIGLTPFEIYLNYDKNAQVLLRSKVLQINEVGADILCILFDDMRGDVESLPDLQARVISDVCAWSNAETFIVCPTYYSYDPRLTREFGPPPKAYLQDLGRIIDRRIDFFWTGEKVISDEYSAQHLAKVAADIGRKPFIWDNYISNDSKTRTNHVFLDPSTGSWDLPASLVAGVAINPMNQAYLSRIALWGYRHLLRQEGKAQPVFPEICRDLCGPSVAERLLADTRLFQNAGLANLGTDTRRELLDWYESEKLSPYAQEIAAWLRGEYAFDPQCLTT
jgi:hyaluronoglucosaminidase